MEPQAAVYATTSDLDLTHESGSGPSLAGLQTRLLVRGYEGSTLTLDDLWRVFSCYGEVASVIIEPGHGATVTYRDQCSFPELEPGAELELVCGEQRVLVSRHQVWPLEGAEWPQQHLYPLPPPPLYCPPPPPLSPHYDAAILDVGQPSPLYSLSVPPPPILGYPQTSAFSFDCPPASAAPRPDKGSCHVCAAQLPPPAPPLTPMTPSYPAPGFMVAPPQPGYWSSLTPPFYPPPGPAPSSTLLTLSGTSLNSGSGDSASCVMPIGSETGYGNQAPAPVAAGKGGKEEKRRGPAPAKVNYQLFTSPYKKFSKFQGVPTPARFPLPSANSASCLQGGGGGREAKILEEEEDKSSWYQAGDRWGHRRSMSAGQVNRRIDCI